MNSQYFTKEQVASGGLKKLLDFLMSEAYDNSDYYNDIHIYPADCEAFIVEWVQLPWSHDYGGRGFEYVDDDHAVMLEKAYPDGSIEFFYDEEDYNTSLLEWLKDNPGWKQNDYGQWYNEIENQNIADFFGLNKVCYDDPSEPIESDTDEEDSYITEEDLKNDVD